MKLTDGNVRPVFDGDMLLYKAAVASEFEIEWENGLWTLHSFLDDAIFHFKNNLNEILSTLTTKYQLDLDIPLMALSDTNNFRKDILPTYKANRVGKRKPVCYKALKEWLKENYRWACFDDLEGDDVMGYYATNPYLKQPVLLISCDKDFKTVPCDFYDYGKDVLHHITERDAMRALAYQTLVGDTADNYKGCPTYGPVKANKLLNATEDKDLWPTVIKAFEKQGLTERDALVQARCAHIMQFKDINLCTGKRMLWEFPK